MNRDLDSPDRSIPERELGKNQAAREPEASPLSRDRETIQMRGYHYQISSKDVGTMYEIGRFRTVPLEDLARYEYGGRVVEMREDLASLRAQGLVQERSVWANAKGGRGAKFTVAVLTKTGKEILEKTGPQDAAQKLFAGFVKPGEVRHDAAIYRMYHLEAERIRRSGGRIARVVLDYELKQQVYRPLAKAKTLPPLEYARKQVEIADQNRLKVVRGRILLPDLRIEYERSDGARAHVDLELATDHYRGSHMRGKAEAGFKFYAPQDSVARLSSAFDPDHIAEIFSL